MSWLDDLLGNISQARTVLGDQTGGAEAPAASTAAPAAAAPTTPPHMPTAVERTLQQIASLPQAKQDQLRALSSAMAGLGQSRDHAPAEGGRLASAVDHFGGKVLGFGNRQDSAPGGDGRFADVLKNGLLYHIYGDPSKNMKIDDGAVARSLGIDPKLGSLSVDHPSAKHHSSRDGVPVDPLTGGVRGPRPYR